QDVTPSLDNILTLANKFDDILGVTTSTVDSHGEKADVSNMETTIIASPTPTLRIHKDHPKSQIIGPMDTPIQTRHKSKEMEEQSFIATIHQMTTLDILQFCLFSCFNVWTLVDYPEGVRPIGTKWVLKNKKDERGIVIRNKARLVAQGHTHEEGINYEEVFAPMAKIETIKLFLAYSSFMGFTVYQMDVKSAFLYGDFLLVQVYVDDIIFGSSNPLLCREFEALMHEKFQMSAMGELNFFLGLQVTQKEDDIFLSQDKYVGDILKKFGYTDVRSANTPMDKENPWGKDGSGKD
nr:copia protein [Tanacetum cinerariifolium]